MNKQEYTTPKITKKAYAQFENVFTYCDKGNAYPRNCQYVAPGNPSQGPGSPSQWAAFADPIGS